MVTTKSVTPFVELHKGVTYLLIVLQCGKAASTTRKKEQRSRVGVLGFSLASLVYSLKLEAMTINGHHSPLGASLLVVSNTKGKMLLMEASLQLRD